MVNVLPVPIVIAPALLNAADWLKFLPFWIVKLPVEAFVVILASVSVPVPLLSNCEEVPSRMIVATLVVMLPGSCIAPRTLYVPPVSVPPERFVRLLLTVSVVPDSAFSMPLLVTVPLRTSVPLCTSTMPLLLKGVAIVALPEPIDLVSVFELFNVPVPAIIKSPWMSPGPALLSVRFNVTLPVIAILPCACVMPAPAIVPPVQVSSPVAVTEASPDKVPGADSEMVVKVWGAPLIVWFGGMTSCVICVVVPVVCVVVPVVGRITLVVGDGGGGGGGGGLIMTFSSLALSSLAFSSLALSSLPLSSLDFSSLALSACFLGAMASARAVAVLWGVSVAHFFG